jgi:hypothetical protein
MSCNDHSCQTKSTGTLSGLFLFLGLAAISAALLVTGIKIYDGLKNFRSYDRYVTVKGLSTKDMKADLAVWFVNFTATGDDMQAAQATLDANAQEVVSYLKAQGLTEDEIRLQNIQAVDKQAQTYNSGEMSGPRFVLSQAFIVRTTEIEKVTKASQNVAQLLKKGVLLGQPNGGYNPPPQYLFTKLNDVKPEMIATATKNARASAEQFAADSGQKVEQIRSANQGVFEILPRDPSLVETETPDKTIRVVSTVEYYLGD